MRDPEGVAGGFLGRDAGGDSYYAVKLPFARGGGSLHEPGSSQSKSSRANLDWPCLSGRAKSSIGG